MLQTRQQSDLELWRRWQSTRDPMDLKNLLDNLAPLIQREVGKWGSTVPQAALESKARMLAAEALETYNPNMGAAVGTHVASRLRKLSRSVYPYQNVARLPENKQLLFNTFQIAQNSLMDTTGREPTVEELSDHLGWSKKKVNTFQQEFGRRELVESEGMLMGDKDDSDEGLVDFYYHELNPMDQKLFEDITGYGGVSPMANKALMKKHNLTQGQLSYRKSKFINRIKQIQSGEV